MPRPLLKIEAESDFRELDRLIFALGSGDFINRAGEAANLELKNIVSVRTGRLKRSLVWERYRPATREAAFVGVFYGLAHLSSKKPKVYIDQVFRKHLRADLRRTFGF